MFKPLFKTLVAVLAIAAAAAGPAWGQNASPDVTLDFTTNSWNIPAGKTNITYAANSYTSGDYTITLQGGGSSSNGYYFHNDGYLLLGKNGSYLELPEFESAVDSIVVVGKSGASTAVEQNIYVGGTAVSTQTTGATGTNTYVINANYQAAGNIYTLKVESAQNTQITYIKVYFVSAPAVPHTVRFASGNDGWTVTDVDSARSAVAPAVLSGVMAGDSLVVTAPATLPGKVKSVKAVKYVPPAATVTTAPTATEATIVANSTSALVNAGVASGGTMMYAVTTTNAQPASTADFSDAIPTAQGRTAGTYYVWYYAKADDSHTDSEISATAVAVTVNGIVWTTADMTSNFYANFNDGWTNNNTHQGITVTASGTAQGGWSQNNIDVNDGSGTITFTSSVGNIKSIVITAQYMNNMDMNVPAGWTTNAMMNNPRTLSWSGTASATVNLPLSNMQNIGNISTIVFTLE